MENVESASPFTYSRYWLANLRAQCPDHSEISEGNLAAAAPASS